MGEIRAAVCRLQSLHEARKGRASLREQEAGKKRGREEAAACSDEDEGDRVVSFNVRGVVVSVLRSTLLTAAPDSWFSARVSGRWTEQAGDVDEDGNIEQVSE